jgi:hypothetical protein
VDGGGVENCHNYGDGWGCNMTSPGWNCPVTVSPSITSISPAQGAAGATTYSIVISGAGLAGGTVNAGSGISVTVQSTSAGAILADFNVSSSATPGNNSVTVSVSGQTSNALNFYVQVPTSLSIVSGTDSTSSETSCTTGSNTGCGVTRSFTYQVYDQHTPTAQPIQTAGLQIWDSISTGSPNNLSLTSYTTTCSPTQTNSGPCGRSTNSSGQFADSLPVCSTVCNSSGVCVTGGPTNATQTVHVGSFTITQSLGFYCSYIHVNGY